MGQPLHEDAPLPSDEVGPLDAVAVGFGPIQPVVVGRDAVGPSDTLGHDAGHVGSIHVASVNARRLVSPVSPEHQTGHGEDTRLGICTECAHWPLFDCDWAPGQIFNTSLNSKRVTMYTEKGGSECSESTIHSFSEKVENEISSRPQESRCLRKSRTMFAEVKPDLFSEMILWSVCLVILFKG